MKTQQSITVNEKEIQIITDGQEKYVGIRPICEAIGISYAGQFEKIKNDEILGPVIRQSLITASDGKDYKMNVFPFRFVFGWLFTINPKNVKPEIKDDIVRYKMECYNALYDSFTKRNEILKEKTSYQIEIQQIEEDLKQDQRYKRIQELKSQMKNASQRLNSLDKSVISEQLDVFKEKEKEKEEQKQ